MTDQTIDISCTGPTPNDVTVANGDKVTFDNTTGASVTITFSGNGIFNPSPGASTTIDKDASKTYTIGNAKASDEQDYSYPDCTPELDARTGKIRI